MGEGGKGATWSNEILYAFRFIHYMSILIRRTAGFGVPSLEEGAFWILENNVWRQKEAAHVFHYFQMKWYPKPRFKIDDGLTKKLPKCQYPTGESRQISGPISMKKIYQSIIEKEFSGSHSHDTPLVKNGQVFP